jgi:hypothetical protein
MGTGTLPDNTDVATGELIEAADILSIISAMNGVWVGRNTSGVATLGQSLGTSLYPWGNAFITDLIVGGSSIDVSGLAAAQNRIISGKTRSTSGQPFFLNPNGAAASVAIQGATTTLTVSINGTTVEVTTDITESGLTTAPAANNTCAINDTSFVDQDISKYFGEIDSSKQTITIDTVGSEISSRVGQIISLKTGTSEIMFGYLKSATEFTNVKRGFFFDSSNNPIVRETIANNDTLTLLETGWIFITNDGTTVDVTYTTPVYAYTAPTGPATGDYWYDISNQVWKRYSGVEFVSINRTLLGVCVQDTSNCIGARSFDFANAFKDDNTIDLDVFSDTVVRSLINDNTINIYGTDLEIPYTYIEWDNSADMETGSVAADTNYRLYLDTNGQSKISTERPYDRQADLKGRYHPYNNWRYVGEAKTDADSDWLSIVSVGSFDLSDKSAKFEAENMLFDHTDSTTGTLTADSVKFISDTGETKTRQGINSTFDITLHRVDGTGTTNELPSTNYWCWEDFEGRKAMVPDLTGTADSDVLNSLSDSSAAFQTHKVQRWDKIYQLDDKTIGYVKAVTGEGVLTCMDADGNDLDLFPLGTEDYLIRGLSPIGLGAFKIRAGALSNNSSSNLDDSFYTQIQEEKRYSEAAGDFTITGATWTTTAAEAIYTQVNDWTGLGIHYIELLCAGSRTTGGAGNYSIAMSGVTFKTGRSFTGFATATASSSIFVSLNVTGGSGSISVYVGAAASGFNAGYIKAELDSKPTFHT